MIAAYKTVYDYGFGEIVVKKSRFIANVQPVHTEEEAIAFIEQMKKKYWDASHNCSAYIIGTVNPIMHCSDDGEPAKTAGRPMLDILLSQQLTDVVVVVTRYFGGTLLGTGGLVRAYSNATLEGLSQSRIIIKEPGFLMELTTDYTLVGKVQYYISQEAFPIISSEYLDYVRFKILVPVDKKLAFINKLTELTSGTAAIVEKEQVYFTILDNEIHLF